MQIKRENIIDKFPWLIENNKKYIISSSYDGVICASFLNHFLNWELVGYYDFESLWISRDSFKYKEEIIWVDLNILPIKGRAIGGHIVAYDNQMPKGFSSSCNPNCLANLSSSDFKLKYPFSTIIFLLWLHNIYVSVRKESKFSILHADDVWLKFQKYTQNCSLWSNTLTDYNWELLFDGIDTKTFEKNIIENLYPYYQKSGFINTDGKIFSKFYNTKSKQLWINPDWDEDLILNLSNYFAETLGWTPFKLPEISKRIDGKKQKVNLSQVKETGLNNFIKKNKIFSYAITSSKTLSYTVFEKMKKNPIQ